MEKRRDLPSDDTPKDPGDDPHTAREEFELDLMDEGDSEAGEEIGDEMP